MGKYGRLLFLWGLIWQGNVIGGGVHSRVAPLSATAAEELLLARSGTRLGEKPHKGTLFARGSVAHRPRPPDHPAPRCSGRPMPFLASGEKQADKKQLRRLPRPRPGAFCFPRTTLDPSIHRRTAVAALEEAPVRPRHHYSRQRHLSTHHSRRTVKKHDRSRHGHHHRRKRGHERAQEQEKGGHPAERSWALAVPRPEARLGFYPDLRPPDTTLRLRLLSTVFSEEEEEEYSRSPVLTGRALMQRYRRFRQAQS